MDKLLEKLLIDIIKKLLTPDVTQQAKENVVAFLRGLAADTANGVDDAMVDIIAAALGVA